MSGKAEEIVNRFRKIMGPVASTLAQEAAKESGGRVEGGKVMVDGDANLEKFKRMMKKKCGKIIGERLAETILKEG